MADDSRVLVWFSCGAASAVAGQIAIQKYGHDRVELVYCDVLNTEHGDNQRFMRDVEEWLGKKVTVLKSEKYNSIDEVFEKRKYLAGIAGAPCTGEMKKAVRFRYQRPDDIHVFGYTTDEKHRVERFEGNNPEMRLDWVLIDNSITKAECHARIAEAGIQQPVMYQLGFKNNNCIACVKAGSVEYWQKVKHHFPEVFKKRAEQSRRFGARLLVIDKQRFFIDELPEEAPFLFDPYEAVEENISCGPDCKGGPNG